VVIDVGRAYHEAGSSVWMLDDSRLPSLRPGQAWGNWANPVTRKNTAAHFGQWVTGQERSSGGSCEGRALLLNFERMFGWNEPGAVDGVRVLCELASDAGFGSTWIFANHADSNPKVLELVDGRVMPTSRGLDGLSARTIPIVFPREYGAEVARQTLAEIAAKSGIGKGAPSVVLWAASDVRNGGSTAETVVMLRELEAYYWEHVGARSGGSGGGGKGGE
jgi:hypothetical protein